MGGRERAQRASAGSQAIDMAKAFKQRLSQAIDGCHVAKIDGDERGLPAERADFVVEAFERFLTARESNDAPISARKLKGCCAANAARSAGDDDDALVLA
jgi:hypothetical protein